MTSPTGVRLRVCAFQRAGGDSYEYLAMTLDQAIGQIKKLFPKNH